MTGDESGAEAARIERGMRRISRGLSGFAIALMLAGLLLALAGTRPLDPLAIDVTHRPHRLMLSGIVVLCLVPGVRVLAAGAYYVEARRAAQAVVAAVVLLELIASIVSGA